VYCCSFYHSDTTSLHHEDWHTAVA
jgi:hypothetical protein